MKSNYIAFLVLWTCICGRAEVGAQEATNINNLEQTIAFEGKLDGFCSSEEDHSAEDNSGSMVMKNLSFNGNGAKEKEKSAVNQINLGVLKIGDLIQEKQANSVVLRGLQSNGLVEATNEELNRLTNKGDTLVGTKEDMAMTLNVFLETFKDSFNQAKTESLGQLSGTAEEGVEFLLDALKDQAVVWGETAKNIMNQLVDVASEKYPTVTNILINELKKIKFTNIEGKLVALIREKAESEGCCGCLARSALNVYQYYKSQGQEAPIVVPKEDGEALSEMGVDLNVLD